MKYLLFGTGDYYERYKKWFPLEDILALMDNSAGKQGTRIDGIPVLSPEKAVKLPYERIVILSFYFKEMKAQLLELGIDPGRIFHFYDLHKLLPEDMPKREIRYWEPRGTSAAPGKKSVLLLSNDLTLGGPALALLHAAKTLQKNNYDVIYASMLDGPLRETLVDLGIGVVVDENLQWETMREVEWIKDFDLLICNTLNFHVFLSDRDGAVPVIWWLHDSSFFYHGVGRKVLDAIDMRNLRIVSVGPVPRDAIWEYRRDFEIGDLLYGVSIGS